MKNEEILLDYLNAWKRFEFDVSVPVQEPAGGMIPNTITTTEASVLRALLRPQKVYGPNHTRFVFLCRTLAVLKWHYKRHRIHKDALDTIRQWAVCLGEKAALVIVPELTEFTRKKKRKHKKVLNGGLSESVTTNAIPETV